MVMNEIVLIPEVLLLSRAFAVLIMIRIRYQDRLNIFFSAIN